MAPIYFIMKEKKLAILGTAYTRVKAPFDDPDCEIWAVAPCLMKKDIKRIDRVFELHQEESYIHENFYQALKDYEGPIYVQEDRGEFRRPVRYPIEGIIAKYGHYFTNSICYCIALALEEGFREIHLYGIHLTARSEYAFERPCVEYFIGIAMGKGVKICIPEESDLLKSGHLYGYEEIDGKRKKIMARMEDFDTKINELKEVIHEYEAKINQYAGAKADCDYFLKML